MSFGEFAVFFLAMRAIEAVVVLAFKAVFK